MEEQQMPVDAAGDDVPDWVRNECSHLDACFWDKMEDADA